MDLCGRVIEKPQFVEEAGKVLALAVALEAVLCTRSMPVELREKGVIRRGRTRQAAFRR